MEPTPLAFDYRLSMIRVSVTRGVGAPTRTTLKTEIPLDSRLSIINNVDGGWQLERVHRSQELRMWVSFPEVCHVKQSNGSLDHRAGG